MTALPPVAILAGGRAERLRPLTETLPKALVPVQGKPFLAHQLEQLAAEGITEVVCCVGYKGEMIEAAIGDGDRFGLSIRYAHDGTSLRGTGGAIKKALPLLGPEFFILYGDSYLHVNYRAVKAQFDRQREKGVLTVFKNRGAWDTSNLQYQDHRIVAYSKKKRIPEMTYIDYGLSLLQSAVFDHYPDDAVLDLADVYEALVHQDQLAGFEVTERFYEIGSMSGLRELETFLQRRG